MQALVNAFTSLFTKLNNILAWIGKLWAAIFAAGWDFLQDGVSWVLEQGMKIALSAIQAFDVSAISTASGIWGSIPAGVLEVCGALGLGTAFAIILSAIGIRLLLQLIPFVRLGS
jgi:hypothetical protein